MKLSVVVATHNRPQLLGRALESIACPPGHELQIVVVDDNSTEENRLANRAAVAAHGASATYVWLPCSHGQGNGASVARNVGVEQSDGDVIGFCDDDDYWASSSFPEFALGAFESDPGLDMAIADMRTEFQGAVTREHWFPALRSRLPLGSKQGYPFYRITAADLLVWPGTDLPSLNTTLLRRSLLDRCGGFVPAFRYGEDFDLLLRALDLATGVGYADEIACIHERPDRSREMSLSSIDDSRKLAAGIQIMHHLLHCCSTQAVRRYARNHLADTYRSLAHRGRVAGAQADAFLWAKAGLAWRFNWRWAAMTIYLAARTVGGRTGGGARQ